jgi:hypothetical protein
VKYQVLAPLRARAANGEITLEPGQAITLAPEKALRLVEGGKLKPINDHENLDLQNMTLADFSRTQLALKVKSAVLGETILFVSNEAVAEKMKEEGFICYTARELTWLCRKQLLPEELRKIHEVKAVFPGSRIEQ